MKSFAVDLDTLLAVSAGILDADGVLLEANAGFLRLLPAEPTEPIGAKIARFFIQPNFAALLAIADVDESVGYSGLITIGDPMGKTRSLLGRVWRTSIGIRVLAEYDIAELERLNDAILDLHRESAAVQQTLSRANVVLKQRASQSAEDSLMDTLTGVGNRRKMEQALATEINRARRHGGALSAIMADVDHFKRVNDEYGHAAGDKVLVRFGAMLRSQTRPTDIVARFGGEEFVVLMPQTSLAQAAGKAELIRSALAAEVIEPLARPVTSSFGVAELLPDEDGPSLLRRVDTALYRAKEDGRDRVALAGPCTL